MAKIDLVVVFSLILVLISIQSASGDGSQISEFAVNVLSSVGDEMETLKGDFVNIFSPEVKTVSAEVRDAAQTGREAAYLMREEAKAWISKPLPPEAAESPGSAGTPPTNSSSMMSWFKDKLRSIGLLAPKETPPRASTPEPASRPPKARPLGPAPAPSPAPK